MEALGLNMGFEETELRLGLPGNRVPSEGEGARKRGFSETVDLKLNLSSKDTSEKVKSFQKEKHPLPRATDPPAKPPAK